MVRHGGKVCWGSTGVIPAIPSYTEIDQFIPAGNFSPAQAPENPAPINDYYIAANGMTGKCIKFITNSDTAASTFFANRLIIKPAPLLIMNAEICGFTDGGSVNNIVLQIGYHNGTFPAGNFSTAPTWIAPQPATVTADYLMMRSTFQIPVIGTNYTLWISRQMDTNPGNFYCTGLMLYFRQALL